jgi:hypothetical protein
MSKFSIQDLWTFVRSIRSRILCSYRERQSGDLNIVTCQLSGRREFKDSNMGLFRSLRSMKIRRIIDSSRNRAILAALVFLVGGFGLRMLDLTDPPLDFHPSRQLYSYTIARGLYYQMTSDADPVLRERAIHAGEETDRYEPRIQEGILAILYLLTGGERFWIARILTSLVWIAGGWILFCLASRMTTPVGALFSLGYYLFLPFAIQASRSFQPDILMILSIIATAYCLFRWSEEETWRWSLIAGLVGGFAVLVKAQGIFAVTAMAILTVLIKKGFFKAVINPKIWVMAGLMIVIPAVYYLGPWVSGGGAYFANFTIAMSRLLQDPGFYVRWANFIHDFMDMGVIVLALLGSLLFNRSGRSIAFGLWIGYGVLGLFFPWQIGTHDYYSLVLVPTVALGLAPIGSWLAETVQKQGWVLRGGFLLVCVFAIAYPAWTARSGLFGKNYRNEWRAWEIMGEELPAGANIIALTHDYGWRLQYWGYTPVKLWPYNADNDLHIARGGNLAAELQPVFDDLTSGQDYFLITHYGELEAQPQLKQILYEKYPIVQRGDGYILFDLNHPTSAE